MTNQISPREFQEAEDVEDWRVLGDGTSVFFRTESFSASTLLVQVIGALAGIDAHPPAVDARLRASCGQSQ
jgi:4a-hydroxytetrahydrobiopterin dehydratase